MTSAPDTARVTGAVYLAMAVGGAVGFLAIRSQLYVAGDAAATAANLVEHEGLARLGIAADLVVVVTQAVAAVWFFVLFRPVNAAAAGALAAFGLVNSTVVLLATAFSATALEVALDGAPSGGSAATSLLLFDLNGATWNLGSVFFGLWLIPMGWLARRTGTMPAALGWILMAGGVGYVLAAFARYLAPDLSALAGLLPLPATVGEFWMIGYLLLRGAPAARPVPVA